MLPDERYNDAAKGAENSSATESSELREWIHEWVTLMQENHAEALEDIEFIASKQWDPAAAAEREEDGRPCMTFPKLTQFVDQVVGDQMQQRPSIQVRAADGVASAGKITTESKKELEIAKVYSGIVRQIERVSHARIAYDNAFEGAVTWGFGNWRVLTEYVQDSFFQEIRIAPIWDPFAVAWDPGAMEYTREDATCAAVRAKISRKEFKRKYPGATAASYDFGVMENSAEWIDAEGVYLAEWFRKTETIIPMVLLSDGRVVRGDDVATVKDELARTGVTVSQERKHKGHKVEWSLWSGVDRLEEWREFPSQFIPIVPCWGRMLYREGKMRYRGLIRHAKDEQRVYNYARTAAMEAVALAPKSPYIVALESIKGYEEIWRTANQRNHAYLPYISVNLETGVQLPAPQRQFGAANLQGTMELIQLSEMGMKSTIGIYDANLGQRSNEISGRAIEARQSQGDRGSYPFVANYAKSIEHTGRILIDMIPRVLEGERILRIIHDDETDDTITINQTIIDEQTGNEVVINDISSGRFDVVADVGPNFLTQRMQAVDSMVRFIQAVPAAGPLIADIVARNQDWPGADAVAERLKKGLVPPQVQESGDGEMSPQAMAAIQQAQQQAQMMQQQLQALAQEVQQLNAKADSASSRADKAEISLAQERAVAKIREEQDKLEDLLRQVTERKSEVTDTQDIGIFKQEVTEALHAQSDALAEIVRSIQAMRQS